MISQEDIGRLKSLQFEIDLPQTDYQLVQIKDKSAAINWKGIVGTLEAVVEAEAKREALAARDAALQAQGIPPSREALATDRFALAAIAENSDTALGGRKQAELRDAVREKMARNFSNFLKHMAALHPHVVEQMAGQLTHARPLVRYQAWGKALKRTALWSSAHAGGDLALADMEYCSAPDRIEMIDRIGIRAGHLTPEQELRLRDPFWRGITLSTHTFNRQESRHMPFYELILEGGLRLTGAARPMVVPRASVPCLEFEFDFDGWVMVEGWRLSLG